MRIVNLILKDWRQLARDPKTALFLLAMPILFTVFFGFIFGGDGASDTRLVLGIVDHDGGAQSGAIRELVDASEAIRARVLAEAEWDRLDKLLRDEEIAAVLEIPAGYSQAVLEGQYPRLSLILDKETVTGQTVHAAVMSVLQRYWGTLKVAQISAETIGGSPEQRTAVRERALQRAQALWEEPALGVEEKDYPQADESPESSINYYTQASPGMIVQFAIYGLMTAATALVIERKSGTLRRLLTTPMSRAEILVGKGLAMFALVLFQELILVIVGQLLFKVDYAREPVAVMLVCVSVAAWSASLGMLVGAIAKREEGVIVVVLILMFFLAALGGAWFPLEITGETFAAVGHVLPSAWAMDGFQNLIIRGQGLESVLLPSAIMWAYALVFMGVAVWRFRFD